MQYVFVHLGAPFDGLSLSQKPLGGTETALIGVSRELAKNPENSVHVFTLVNQSGVYDGVTYHPITFLKTWSENGGTADVLVSIRQWMPLVLPIRARIRVYFSPDAWNQPFLHRAFEIAIPMQGRPETLALFTPADFMANTDRIFCVGKWQAETFESQLGLPREKIFITANGIFLENFSPLDLPGRNRHLVYSSTPFRGLEHLVRYFPQIKGQVPDAGLDVCSGMMVYGSSAAEDQKAYGALYQSLQDAGAVLHGSLKQSELAKLMCGARVFSYPNTFEETFCISVLEAQAAGLPVVTSAKAALCERVTHGVDGFLVQGDPGTASYDREFVEAVNRLLVDDDLWLKFSSKARAKAAAFTYNKLAADWQEYFKQELDAKKDYSLPHPVKAFDAEVIEARSSELPLKKFRLDRRTVRNMLKQAFALYGW